MILKISNLIFVDFREKGSLQLPVFQCDHQNSCMGTTNDPQKHEKMGPGTSLQNKLKTN